MPVSQTALQRMGTFSMQKGRSLMSSQSSTCAAVCSMLPQNEDMKWPQMHMNMHA